MKRNDMVRLLKDTKPDYDFQKPILKGTEAIVVKASRNGTLRCNYKGKFGSDCFNVNVNDVELVPRQGNMPKVGDLFYSAWGYGQTNIDFFQVTAVKSKSVEVVSINGKNLGYDARCFQGTVTPVPDSFSGEPMTKIVRFNGENQPYFKVASYATAWPTQPGSIHNFSDGN